MDTSKKLNQKGLEKLANFAQSTLKSVIERLETDPDLCKVLEHEEFQLELQAYQDGTWQVLSSFRDFIIQHELVQRIHYSYVDFHIIIKFFDYERILDSVTSYENAKEAVEDITPDQIRASRWSALLEQLTSRIINSHLHLAPNDCHISLTLLFFPAADEIEEI